MYCNWIRCTTNCFWHLILLEHIACLKLFKNTDRSSKLSILSLYDRRWRLIAQHRVTYNSPMERRGVEWDWVHLVRRPLIGLLYQPRMIDDDDDECGAVGGMIISRGSRSTLSKLATVPLCLPQIPHEMTGARTWAAAVVGSRRLTAWAMTRLVTSVRSLACNWRGGVPGSDLMEGTSYPYWSLLSSLIRSGEWWILWNRSRPFISGYVNCV
jgi:hypothetical protein